MDFSYGNFTNVTKGWWRKKENLTKIYKCNYDDICLGGE